MRCCFEWSSIGSEVRFLCHILSHRGLSLLLVLANFFEITTATTTCLIFSHLQVRICQAQAFGQGTVQSIGTLSAHGVSELTSVVGFRHSIVQAFDCVILRQSIVKSVQIWILIGSELIVVHVINGAGIDPSVVALFQL